MDEYLRLSGGADKAQQARIKQVSILVSSTKKKNLYCKQNFWLLVFP